MLFVGKQRPLLLVLTLLGFGLLKTPLEQALVAAQRAHGFQLAELSLSTREQLGQAGFVAALSGFRAVRADMLWIRAGTAFEQTAWSRMELLLRSATQLQPKATQFWEMAQYHMAYDAATSARYNEKALPSSALRRKAEMQFIRIGEGFLKDGLAFNPQSARLWERLGDLYSRRLENHLLASEAYTKASLAPKSPSYLRRFAAYELAKIPGQEAAAYQRLKELYLEGSAQRLPTLVRLVSELEEKLAVPQDQRAYSRQSSAEPGDVPRIP
jgi:hypothetical protein